MTTTTTESLGWEYTFEDNAEPRLSSRKRGWRLGNPHGIKELWFDADVFMEGDVKAVQSALRKLGHETTTAELIVGISTTPGQMD